MKDALENLLRVTRRYIAPGILEVDDAIMQGIVALDKDEPTEGVYPEQEGFNPKMPRYF